MHSGVCLNVGRVEPFASGQIQVSVQKITCSTIVIVDLLAILVKEVPISAKIINLPCFSSLSIIHGQKFKLRSYYLDPVTFVVTS